MTNSARHLKWEEIPFEKLGKLIRRRFVHGESIMLAQLRMAHGAVVPLHSHHNEQLSYILEGALKFWIGAEEGEAIVVGVEETLLLPAHLPHKVEALEDSVVLDLFSPPREDWVKGEDAYLRGSAPHTGC